MSKLTGTDGNKSASIGHPNGALTLGASDASLVRECVKMAIETLSDTLSTAERQSAGKLSSTALVKTLARYRSDVADLLERLEVGR